MSSELCSNVLVCIALYLVRSDHTDPLTCKNNPNLKVVFKYRRLMCGDSAIISCLLFFLFLETRSSLFGIYSTI